MKVINTKSIIIVAITFVLFLTGSMLVVNKCTGASNDIAIVGDTLTSEGKVMEFDYQNHKFINIVKSDSIIKANFRVVLSKLNSLHNDNIVLMKEVKTLRVGIAMLKKMKTNCTYKPVHRKAQPKKRR